MRRGGLRRASLVLALATVACRPTARIDSRPPLAAPQPALTLVELGDLIGVPQLPAPRNARDPEAYRQAIRSALSQVSFYQNFAPKLFSLLDVHTKDLFGTTLRDTLGSRTLPSGSAYFYNERLGDCGGTDLIQVRPWWDRDTEITICRDSVRADIVKAPNGAYCDSMITVAECGCGPHLLFCAPSPEYRKELASQAREEIVRTLKYVVESGAPYSSLFTMNSTVRSTFGEYWYARSAFLQGEAFKLPPLSEQTRSDFSLRPRRPEHTGGILTSPYVLYADTARRTIVQNLWTDLLCVEWKAVGVDVHTLLKVASQQPDLRSTTNRILVETPGCRSCHVRLEYPALAISEFVNGMEAGRFVRRAKPTTIKFYVRGYEDFRGDLPASPQALAEMITTQPDFQRCAVKHVTEFAFQGHEVSTSLTERLLADFSKGHNLGHLIENSLIARIFGENALR